MPSRRRALAGVRSERTYAEQWQAKAAHAGPWEEQVMQFHLLGELAAAQRTARP
jgi:hypothetical protein